MKQALDPQEVLNVATAHLNDGVEQQILARLLGVNHGRITEACIALDYARNHIKEIYEVARGQRYISEKIKPPPKEITDAETRSNGEIPGRQA